MCVYVYRNAIPFKIKSSMLVKSERKRGRSGDKKWNLLGRTGLKGTLQFGHVTLHINKAKMFKIKNQFSSNVENKTTRVKRKQGVVEK